ncbi:Gag-like protein, partial [Operophtera brumata]
SLDRGSDDAPALKVIVVEEEQSRGRAPTTGHNVGLAEAEVALEALQRAEVELQNERELADETRSRRSPRVVLSRISESEVQQADELLSTDLSRRVRESLGKILSVAKDSGNLKGTFIRDLKVAAASIREAMEVLQDRSSTEETRRLQAANVRLRDEVRELRQEIVELRREMLEARAAIPAPHPPERSSHGRAGTPGAAAGRGKLTVPRGAVGETPEPRSGPSSTPAVMQMTQSLPSVILTGKKRARDIT